MAVFSDIRHIETEMLIVGAGVAGMMAATAALRVGITPVVATKGSYASGSSSMANPDAISFTIGLPATS